MKYFAWQFYFNNYGCYFKFIWKILAVPFAIFQSTGFTLIFIIGTMFVMSNQIWLFLSFSLQKVHFSVNFNSYVHLILKSKCILNISFFASCQTRLQAQAAGVPYSHPLSNVMSRMAYFGPNMVSIHCLYSLFLWRSYVSF